MKEKVTRMSRPHWREEEIFLSKLSEPGFPEAPAGSGRKKITRAPGREALLGKWKPVKTEQSPEAGV